MLGWDHGGGFSLNGSVRIEATDNQMSSRNCRLLREGSFKEWNAATAA
jgi:hypothetical protein